MRSNWLIVTAVAFVVGTGIAWAAHRSHSTSNCCFPGSECCFPGSPCCASSDCCAAGLSCCPDGACCQGARTETEQVVKAEKAKVAECCAPGAACCYPGSPCCATEDCCAASLPCCPDGACCGSAKISDSAPVRKTCCDR